MKKYLLVSLLLISSVFAVNAGAKAEVVDSIKIYDVDNSIIRVSGSLDEGEEDSVVSFIFLKDGETIGDKNLYNGKDGHIAIIETEKDGTYTYDFKFTGDSGKYNVRAKNGTDEYSKVFELRSYEDLFGFANDLRDKKIKENDIYEKIEYFGDSLGVDTKKFDLDWKKSIVENILYEKSPESLKDKTTLTEKISAIQGLIENSVKTVEFIDKMNDAVIWNSVHSLLINNTDITGIDLSVYNSLSASGQMNVCSAFLKTEFTSVKQITDLFTTEVNKQKSQSSGSGSSGGSSGGKRNSVSRVILPTYNTNTDNKISFNDLSNAEWAREAIEYLAERNIINGTGDKTFSPSDNLTREALVKIAALAFGFHDGSLTADFEDVEADAWYSSYIASAKKANIVNGISETDFGVGSNITRQDLAVILYRGALYMGKTFEGEDVSFNDENEIDEYAKEAVAALSKAKIINGDNGNFRPKSYATRAEAAKIVYEIIKGAE